MGPCGGQLGACEWLVDGKMFCFHEVSAATGVDICKSLVRSLLLAHFAEPCALMIATLIPAACFRASLFEGALQPHPKPYIVASIFLSS